MKQIIKFSSYLVLTSLAVTATAKPLDLSKVQQCQKLISQCPKTGPVYQANCVNRTVSNQASCSGLGYLAHQLKTSADTLNAKQVGKLYLISQQFFADGQVQYYLLTPKNQLINTVVDPRSLSKPLAKKFQSASFLIANAQPPKFTTNKKGQQIVTAKLQIKNGCVACPVVGSATVQFSFNKKGKYLSQQLINFSDTSNKSTMNTSKK